MLSIVQAQSFSDELEKIALSRLEKEIAAGRVSRGDVPGLPAGATKAQAQESFLAPAQVSPERLAKTRRLNEAVYRNRMKLTQGQLRSIGEPSVGLKKEHVPGMGPATLMGDVYVPESTGRFMRTYGEGRTGKLRAALGTYEAQNPELANRALLPAHPMDPTLNRAVLGHEMGEAAEIKRMGDVNPRTGKISAQPTPVSSHMGVKPLLEEQMVARGDPEAIRTMQRLRGMEQGDVSVQRAIRQAGGTPDRPLAVGGKQERAVRRIMSRKPENIGQAGRGRALQMYMASEGKITPSYAMPTEALETAKSRATALKKPVQQLFQTPGTIREKAQQAVNIGKQIPGVVRPAAQVSKWVSTGAMPAASQAAPAARPVAARPVPAAQAPATPIPVPQPRPVPRSVARPMAAPKTSLTQMARKIPKAPRMKSMLGRMGKSMARFI